MEEEYCLLCYGQATQRHHMIRRSKCKPLINCEMNIAPLCTQCHHDLHFSSGGKKLERKLQLVFLNRLELKLLKKDFSKEDLKEILKINTNAVNSLTKTLKNEKGRFTRQDIIRACLGGKMINAEGEGII